jgi:hypothetical protein
MYGRVVRQFYTILLVILIPLTLHSAITANYDPVCPLVFEAGTSLLTDHLVAHLGTVTITRVGNDRFFTPYFLTVGMDHVFSFTGPYKPNGQYQDLPTQFNLYAVSTLKNTEKAQILDNEYGIHPIRANERGNWNVNNFVAEIYLVSANSLSCYKLNSNYHLTGGVLGNFQIGLSSGGNREYRPGVDPLLPINGGSGTDTTPILNPGTNPADPIGYGEPSVLPTAWLIIKNQCAINLSDATHTGTTKVAEAEIQMLNCLDGDEYAVGVVFTNLANTNPFRLVLQVEGYSWCTIPYELRFNDENVTPGKAVRWEGLTNVPQSQNIMVTGVPPLAADQALSGFYQDTVFVTIIPDDTI